MGYYKILSCVDNRQYYIESLSDGSRRKMRIQYADIVRVKEAYSQIIESSCSAMYSVVSSNLIFVEDCYGKLFPIESKLSELQHQITGLEGLQQNNIIEVKLRNDIAIDIYEVVSVLSPKVKLKNCISSEIIEIACEDIDITTLKVLEDGYALLQQETLVVMDQDGVFHKYDTISKLVNYDTKLEQGYIINIISKDSFTLEEISKELGTKIQDVKIALRNILPDGKNTGTGIDNNIISFRRKQQRLENETNDNSVCITNSEFCRLIQYLKRLDTQYKSIIHWKFYVNKKYPSIQPPTYLDYQRNPFKEEIPYHHLDMDRFENLIKWLFGKVSLMGEVETYFPFFHMLYWSEQISFVQKIIVMHYNGRYKLVDLENLETLVKYPRFININVLIFIHSILKLIKEQKLLSNFELYNIWRTYCPKKNKAKVGLTLQESIGTNLFCTCKGAIGFNKEDWWLPNTNADNKPIFHVHHNEEISLHYNPPLMRDISPSMEDAKKHRSFVVFRADNSNATSCFKEGNCPILDAINSDIEYREELYGRMPSSLTRKESDEHTDTSFSYNDCPLISAPSWRYIWAERHRDLCRLATPPKIKALYLWYNKNRKLRTPFFCEGRLAIDRNNGNPELHRFAKVNFNWCNGNACFTDMYVLPSTTEKQQNEIQQYLEQNINIYNSAIFLGIFTSDDSKAKLEMQRFNSCLNWLNNAAPHFYCEQCDQILEISKLGQPNNNSHAVTWLECQNETCDKAREQIYLSHCWNDDCRSIIDSRETTTCPNKKYICPSCGVCCGEKMFKYKRQAGLSHEPARHFELRKFYCRKCGKQMTRQGDTYYCSDHPEVITKVYK